MGFSFWFTFCRSWYRSLLVLFGGFLLVTLWPGGVGAQSGGIGEVTLFGEEEFTIQAATKTELPISKAPGSVTVISAQQIRESGARTIPEILRLVGGVNVRWNPMVQTVDIRSFGQNPFTSRVLLLIDGVPYNSWNKGGVSPAPRVRFLHVAEHQADRGGPRAGFVSLR